MRGSLCSMKIQEKNIWIISEYYYPIVTSTGYYITEIAEFLSKTNDNINVICTDASYNEKLYINSPPIEKKNGVNIFRIKTGNINKNNLLIRSVRLLNSSIRLFYKILLKIKKNDEILVVTNPAFIILLMPLVKLIKGINYQILVHDIFPENLIAINKLKKDSLFFRLLKLIYDFAYSKSLRCIAIGRDMKEVLVEKTRSQSEVIVIPNWADIDTVFPLEKTKNKYINEYGLTDKFIFQFAGNLGWAQGLPNLMEAIKLIDNANIHFLFIGSGAYENELKAYIKQSTKHNVTHISFIERKYQNEFLNACDVGIVTLSNEMYGLGVPSKSYNIMASGKPILICADENSEISLCVKEFQIGWNVETNNPFKLAETINNIYKNWSQSHETMNNPRDVAEKHFSKEHILSQYLKLLNNT